MEIDVAILCGGLGTRLSEETNLRPKPMIEIGNQPILWHIMKIYSSYGFNNFKLALGYKSEIIKNYFLNFATLQSDLRVSMSSSTVDVLTPAPESWNVDLIDTGLHSMTGGRLLRLQPYLSDSPFFLATYGDGVSDVNIRSLVDFHLSHGKLATMTAVRPPARFGCLTLEGNCITSFAEKPQATEGWINGGFFVFSRDFLSYIDSDDTILEKGPLERLAAEGQLMAYRHHGFWQPMDTLRDKRFLQAAWNSGQAPWKLW